MRSSKKIYLAGPEVFLPEPVEVGKKMKAVCESFGLTGLFPMDAQVELKPEMPGLLKAISIFQADISLIHECDALVANMNPFRGPSMDVGTAFEMGYALALGKPVFGYCEDSTAYHKKVVHHDRQPGRKAEDGSLWDSKGSSVESFDQIDNLMMIGSAVKHAPIARTFEEALLAAHQYFGGRIGWDR
jgi:nucleoside 2-deoxyribosyltransferase